MKRVGRMVLALLGLLVFQMSAASQETTRENDNREDTVIIPPAGALEVRQDVSPLNVQLEKFGNAPVQNHLRLSPTVRASIERPDTDLRTAALRGLTSADRSALDRIIRALRTDNQAAAQRDWRALISQANARRAEAPLDVHSLVQYVLRESYVETNVDLKYHADKVRYFNEIKEAIRDHLSDVRGQYARWSMQNQANFQRARPQTISALVIPASAEPPFRPQYREIELRTKNDWNDYINELEQQQQAVGDDSQLANLDLRMALQKKQQFLQMMSNISKMFHDTANAIIRNLR